MLVADAFENREEAGWMSTPCSIWWKSTPLMPPHTHRSCNGVAFHSRATVRMPARCSRGSMRGPMP
jgi:hypothetical protein